MCTFRRCDLCLTFRQPSLGDCGEGSMEKISQSDEPLRDWHRRAGALHRQRWRAANPSSDEHLMGFAGLGNTGKRKREICFI